MQEKGKILPLTSLRFFAAFMVVLKHTFLYAASAAAPFLLFNLVDISFIPVGFFFVLSGYILSFAYLKSERPVSQVKFWKARIARVYPLLLFSLLLDVPTLYLFELHHTSAVKATINTGAFLAGNMFMLQVWWIHLRQLNNPTWSLAVEAVFYLIFPFVGYALWRLKRQALLPVAFAVYAVTMCLTSVAIHMGIDPVLIKFNPILHLHELILGILTARWHTDAQARPEFTEKLRVRAPWLFWGVVACLIVIVIFYRDLPYYHLQDGLLSPLWMVLIVAAASGNPALDKMLSWSWLVLLGEASYGLYLLHIPMWRAAVLLHLDLTGWAYWVFVASAIIASVITYKLLEVPARRWILRWQWPAESTQRNIARGAVVSSESGIGSD